MTKNYQKEYMKSYKLKNKILTFPLPKKLYKKLHQKSHYYNLSANTYAKQIVVNFLNNNTNSTLTKDRVEFIQQYIRISRWIASNINQIAHQVNIDKKINITLLISLLKSYENKFKKFISKD